MSSLADPDRRQRHPLNWCWPPPWWGRQGELELRAGRSAVRWRGVEGDRASWLERNRRVVLPPIRPCSAFGPITP